MSGHSNSPRRAVVADDDSKSKILARTSIATVNLTTSRIQLCFYTTEDGKIHAAKRLPTETEWSRWTPGGPYGQGGFSKALVTPIAQIGTPLAACVLVMPEATPVQASNRAFLFWVDKSNRLNCSTMNADPKSIHTRLLNDTVASSGQDNIAPILVAQHSSLAAVGVQGNRQVRVYFQKKDDDTVQEYAHTNTGGWNDISSFQPGPNFGKMLAGTSFTAVGEPGSERIRLFMQQEDRSIIEYTGSTPGSWTSRIVVALGQILRCPLAAAVSPSGKYQLFYGLDGVSIGRLQWDGASWIDCGTNIQCLPASNIAATWIKKQSQLPQGVKTHLEYRDDQWRVYLQDGRTSMAVTEVAWGVQAAEEHRKSRGVEEAEEQHMSVGSQSNKPRTSQKPSPLVMTDAPTNHDLDVMEMNALMQVSRDAMANVPMNQGPEQMGYETHADAPRATADKGTMTEIKQDRMIFMMKAAIVVARQNTPNKRARIDYPTAPSQESQQQKPTSAERLVTLPTRPRQVSNLSLAHGTPMARPQPRPALPSTPSDSPDRAAWNSGTSSNVFEGGLAASGQNSYTPSRQAHGSQAMYTHTPVYQNFNAAASVPRPSPYLRGGLPGPSPHLPDGLPGPSPHLPDGLPRAPPPQWHGMQRQPGGQYMFRSVSDSMQPQASPFDPPHSHTGAQPPQSGGQGMPRSSSANVHFQGSPSDLRRSNNGAPPPQ